MKRERDWRERRDVQEIRKVGGYYLTRRAIRACLALHAAGFVTARLYIMVVLTGMVFLLQGCKMGPDYTRPETPKADSWRLTASSAESIANLPWWELLKDQELQRLVRMALEENLDLQIAAANIEEFRAQLMIAKFDLVPSLNYSGNVFGFRNSSVPTLLEQDQLFI